jgi:hypothetical protein
MMLIRCKKCEQWLDPMRFSLKPKMKLGLRSECKVCVSAAAREWNLANPERAATAVARYRKTEGHALKSKAWREANREYMAAYMRAWNKSSPTNGGKIRMRTKAKMPAWANPEKIVAIYAEARQKTVETGVQYVVDHFYPLHGKTVSGLHVEHNLRVITQDENRRKYNRIEEH